MLRRSILALSHRRLTISRVPREVPTQRSPFVCPQREFSSGPRNNVSPGPGPTSKPPETGKKPSKVILGSIAIGTCLIAAYSGGYLDDILGKKQQHPTDTLEHRAGHISTDSENDRESVSVQTDEDSKSLSSDVEDSKESTESQTVVDPLEDTSKLESKNEISTEKLSDLKPEEDHMHIKDEESGKSVDDIHAKGEDLLRSFPTKEATSDENLSHQKVEVDADRRSSEQKTSIEQRNADKNHTTSNEVGTVLQGNKVSEDLVELKSADDTKDVRSDAQEPSTSLLDTYSLRDEVDESASTSSGHIKHSSLKKETSLGALEDLSDAYVSKDGKLILDFLQAIHTAEQRQAELDARVFAEEQRAMKDKYEKELKDARARELMYAEEVAMLEKEVKKERAKAAAALKSLQERLEERLKMELEEKEKEAESKLKELTEFSKAELAASIAREKAAQIEKMAEADLNINALCMAFYARSEEARQTHSIHKLALGALALEDALSNGLPVQAELDALHTCIESVDKDSLLQLALSSLPEEVRVHGTDSPLKLNEKFDALKGTLRHFSLIPPNGGGILAHSLARVASFLKVKEADKSGDGIESLINKVESLLAQGKLAEAADALEDGVKDSKAAEVVNDWLRRARNRAISEQALVLLQSYTTSISLT